MNEMILWFEKPTSQANACIFFSHRGTISFNTAARQLLPAYVDLGFNKFSKTLYIREGKRRSSLSVKNASNNLKSLTISMAASGVSFPVKYEIKEKETPDPVWQAEAKYYDEDLLLKRILSIKDPKTARSCQEMAHLLAIYEGQLKKICRSFSRTIPKSDRLQLAQEGFLDAVLSYHPYLANFPDHVQKEVTRFLKSQIPNYSSSYKEYYSLQQTSKDGSEYENYSAPVSAQAFQNVLDEYDLSHVLTPLELNVYHMLSDGYTRSEICRALKINVCVYNKTHASIKRALSDLVQSQ